MISIIIPTFNEVKTIEATINYLKLHSTDSEIIVVDGGSTDGTIDLLQNHKNVKLLHTPQSGRALQMNYGAMHAEKEILFFLHADTLPPRNFESLIIETLKLPDIIAGSFFTKFTSKGWKYKLLSLLTSIKWRLLTFGDQGLFIQKSVFESIGGYSPIPIMEDVEIQKRIRNKGRFKKLSVPVLTSGRRFQKNGFWKQLFTDIIIWIGYVVGVSPFKLIRLYSYSIDKSR